MRGACGTASRLACRQTSQCAAMEEEAAGRCLRKRGPGSLRPRSPHWAITSGWQAREGQPSALPSTRG
eukprot:CAMPEP_0117665444 /NCGR_PEP_ID=MMETSP0804-20121206/9813_1 /TAXON_ID=1074897 /ORGANISM="Tetraselmis astigmatica, Strain CCMP880" /LENGTH=67 /DNA_ID=CAMNT_0005472857 /DNA_START=327 /DNA_END=530 /DNA_ORIENTATION=-